MSFLCSLFLQEVLEPQFVLVLAWALGQVVKDVQTAEYLASALEAGIPPYLLPALVSVRLLNCKFHLQGEFVIRSPAEIDSNVSLFILRSRGQA